MTFPYNPCNGTNITRADAFLYVAENQGIATEKSYPFEDKVGKCRYNPNERGAYISSVKKVPYRDENALKYAVAAMGPVSATVYRHKSFDEYKKG